MIEMPPSSIIKIVIIGPESTGKSTLCKSLAEHYNTLWCPEFARSFLLEHGKTYSYNNLLEIAKGQIALEETYIEEMQLRLNESDKASPLLFIDTNMYVMKVWCEFVFNQCHQWIIDQIVERKYSFYLLCNTDLPWVKDELREYPDLKTRMHLYHIYKDLLINQEVPWKEISGNNDERLHRAIDHINDFLGLKVNIP
jgi:NadR type nicotinamide-nucleotide adenylyltransferase